MSYDVSHSQAATAARAIMEAKIDSGRASAMKLFEHVVTNAPQDMVAPGSRIAFGMDTTTVPQLAMVVGGNQALTVHRHALGQIASRAGLPGAYINDLVTARESWKNKLGTDTLNEFFHNEHVIRRDDASKNRHLIRAVNGQARGFLSDRYRRIDTRPLVEAYAEECNKLGAVPVEGTVTDTRVALKAFLPMVFEPVPNEVMCLGLEWSNSDFGAGKHAVRMFILRLWCLNGATMEDVLSQVHLGGQLSQDVEFSQRTYESDTRTSVFALRDIIKNTLGPANTSVILETIRRANAEEINWRSTAPLLAKKLLKEELKSVRDAFESNDVINLPAAKSVWRVSNALSWIAGKTEDEDRKLELQRLAGAVMGGAKAINAATEIEAA